MEDEQFFFGRDDEIERLREHVESQPLTIVVGASGTGKSSLVRAGLLPKLHRSTAGEHGQSVPQCYMLPPFRPGVNPIAALEVALQLKAAQMIESDVKTALDKIGAPSLRSGLDALSNLVSEWQYDRTRQRLVLTVDQEEELITMTRTEEECRHFLHLLRNALSAHPDSLRILLTLRSDFEPLIRKAFDAHRPNGSVEGTRWRQGRFIISAMTPSDLRRVVEGPAFRIDLFFADTELVDTLVEEVVTMPGALPLLSFALDRIFLAYLDSNRRDREITWDEYAKIGHLRPGEVGAVVAALRIRAEQIFNGLPDAAHKATMRRLMLRMVATEGGELARRRAYEDELAYPEPRRPFFDREAIEDPEAFLAWLNDPKNAVAGQVRMLLGPDLPIVECRIKRLTALSALRPSAQADSELARKRTAGNAIWHCLISAGHWWASWQCRRAVGAAQTAIVAALNHLIVHPRLLLELRLCTPQGEPDEQQWRAGILLSKETQDALFTDQTPPSEYERRKLHRRLLEDICPLVRCQNQRVAFIKEWLLQERLLVFGREETR